MSMFACMLIRFREFNKKRLRFCAESIFLVFIFWFLSGHLCVFSVVLPCTTDLVSYSMILEIEQKPLLLVSLNTNVFLIMKLYLYPYFLATLLISKAFKDLIIWDISKHSYRGPWLLIEDNIVIIFVMQFKIKSSLQILKIILRLMHRIYNAIMQVKFSFERRVLILDNYMLLLDITGASL